MDLPTTLSALAGGVLLGGAAALFLALHGRVAGVSGLAAALVSRPREGTRTRVAFVVGLIVAGVAIALLAPEAVGAGLGRGVSVAAASGLLVGFGARLGRGCTSGHGVCGIGRVSVPSLVATGLFIASGAVTVLASRALGGGAP